ncbi:MAG: hypothetical protein HQL63_07200 [Magnetococcales bacterium]|nr:hypothetical protein [Magnetococcales bacterium]
MRFSASVVGAGLIFLAFQAWAESAVADITPKVEFSAHVTRGHPKDATQAGKGMMYVGRHAVRTESRVKDQLVRVIYRSDVQEVWILFPERKVYLKQPGPGGVRPPLPDEPASPCRTDKAFSCRRLGPERIQGRDTQHWEIGFTHPEGGRETTQLWVDTRLEIAIREVYHDGGSVQLTEINEGAQSQDLFKIPEDYQQMSLPGASSGAGGAAPR